MQGQYSNEVTATAEREILPGMTLRLDYQHRWLGTIIEDGAGPDFNSVLANPGHVPDSAITAANNDIQQAMTALQAMPTDPVAQANVQNAQAKLSAIQQLANAPTPERTYDAITLSLNKHFSKAWFARAAYTYSRLIGNYEGLYQNETNYIAPNGSNAYDYPDLYVNQNGPLPNDRPHLFKVDGFYTHPIGRGDFVFGLSFTGALRHAAKLHGQPAPRPAVPDRVPLAARGRRADADGDRARTPRSATAGRSATR